MSFADSKMSHFLNKEERGYKDRRKISDMYKDPIAKASVHFFFTFGAT
jgi:hypothetical protein